MLQALSCAGSESTCVGVFFEARQSPDLHHAGQRQWCWIAQAWEGVLKLCVGSVTEVTRYVAADMSLVVLLHSVSASEKVTFVLMLVERTTLRVIYLAAGQGAEAPSPG